MDYHTLSKKIIERAYREHLPPNSRGREADNPKTFAQYFYCGDKFNFCNAPNMVLMEFEDSEKLHWQWICDRFDTYGIINGSRKRAESQVSGCHFNWRNLRFLELIQLGGKHHFLEDITTENLHIQIGHIWVEKKAGALVVNV